MDEKPTLTVKETAARLGIGLRQTYEAIGRGEIPCVRIGGRILVSRQRLDDLINGTAA